MGGAGPEDVNTGEQVVMAGVRERHPSHLTPAAGGRPDPTPHQWQHSGEQAPHLTWTA